MWLVPYYQLVAGVPSEKQKNEVPIYTWNYVQTPTTKNWFEFECQGGCIYVDKVQCT